MDMFEDNTSMNSSQPPFPQLPSLTDLESRMEVMQVSEKQTGEETLSQRVEWFYERHPLLLSLCQDLYNGYTTLLHHFHHSKLQNPIFEVDVFKKEQKLEEASKTIELLKKLVMLIEMEKEVVVEETINLGYKVTSLLEENRELAIEALFMKKEAVRVARCLLKMKDEHFHKVCHLQNQIYELQSLRELENVSSPSCFGLDNSKMKRKKRKVSEMGSETAEKKRSKWFKRLNPFYQM